MCYISELLEKQQHEEARRIARLDKAKDLYHMHDLDEGFWDKVYDVKYKYLANGLTRYYLIDKDGNVIDSFND